MPSSLMAALAGSERKIALLDTNLLVLWISAKLGPDAFISFKRVKAFTRQDVALLIWLMERFESVATTSYVLAEVSNLANELSGQLRDRWFRELAKFAVLTEEKHIPTKVMGSQPESIRFGVTDAALSYLSIDHIIITSEYRLSGYLEALGRNVLNFNHLRQYWLLNA